MNKQNGFYTNCSCMDHIFTLYNMLKIREENNEESFCAFIDFQKVFNLVNHEFLLYKLWDNGIFGKVY